MGITTCQFCKSNPWHGPSKNCIFRCLTLYVGVWLRHCIVEGSPAFSVVVAARRHHSPFKYQLGYQNCHRGLFGDTSGHPYVQVPVDEMPNLGDMTEEPAVSYMEWFMQRTTLNTYDRWAEWALSLLIQPWLTRTGVLNLITSTILGVFTPIGFGQRQREWVVEPTPPTGIYPRRNRV
jgi:hypothetical protein